MTGRPGAGKGVTVPERGTKATRWGKVDGTVNGSGRRGSRRTKMNWPLISHINALQANVKSKEKLLPENTGDCLYDISIGAISEIRSNKKHKLYIELEKIHLH